jgi:hypothetical protein
MSAKEDMLLQMVNDVFPSRDALISFLDKKMNFGLPKNMKKEEVVKRILEERNEQVFCQAVFEDYFGLEVRIGNLQQAFDFYKAVFLFSFFNAKELSQMAEELSKHQTKWKFTKRNRELLIQAILNNAACDELENYVRQRIIHKEIPRIQSSKFGWVLGPLGLLKSTAQSKSSVTEDLIKFLLAHVDYPSPYLEIRKRLEGKLELEVNRHDPLLREKICQLLLVKLSYEEILRVFNELIDDDIVRIQSIERYWNFIATPFGVFEPAYNGEDNLAKLILTNCKEDGLRPVVKGNGTIEDLVQQECIVESPSKVLTEYFGSKHYLVKLAKQIGLVGLRKVEDDETFVQSILLKLGFDVPHRLESIVSLSSELERLMREVKSGVPLTEGRWNAVFSFLEKILTDLILYYGSVLHGRRLKELEEEKREVEIKSWLGKTFKLRKPFDYLTLGELCGLLRSMNRHIQSNKRARGIMIKTFERAAIVDELSLKELDFVTGCRTELTRIHQKHAERKCEPAEFLNRLNGLLKKWISGAGLSRTYPQAIRLKERVTNEFGVTYDTVLNEEGSQFKLKTDASINAEDTWFMVARNDKFPIEPVLVKKYW